jgi:hypothetical protein
MFIKVVIEKKYLAKNLVNQNTHLSPRKVKKGGKKTAGGWAAGWK